MQYFVNSGLTNVVNLNVVSKKVASLVKNELCSPLQNSSTLCEEAQLSIVSKFSNVHMWYMCVVDFLLFLNTHSYRC